MKSITGSVIKDQSIYMLGFGLLMGLISPFFTLILLKLPSSEVLTPLYFSMCVIAGLVVGLINYLIFRGVVYKFLSAMAERIFFFQKRLAAYQSTPASEETYRAEECHIDASSTDILGEISEQFNNLIDSVVNFVEAERNVDKFLDRLKRSLKLEDIADVVLEAFSEYFGSQGSFLLVLERGEFRLVKTQGVDIQQGQIQDTF